MARTTMLAVLLLGLVASAAAQPTFEPTAAPTTASYLDDPSGLPDNSNPGSSFVPGLTFTGFIVVPATGEFAGTESPSSATKVLTNAQSPPGSGVGGDASITSTNGQPFTIDQFTLANPNMNSAVTLILRTTFPDGTTSDQTVVLAGNQSPTPFGPYKNIIALSFIIGGQQAGRKLLGQMQGQAVVNQFALSGLFTSLAPAAAPTAAPAGTPTAPTPAGTPTAPTPAGTPTAPTPAGTPTAPTPAGTPTSPTPAGTPSRTPAGTPTTTPAGTPTTTPTAAPSAAPTAQPPACPASNQYRGPTACQNCISKFSPFVRQYGKVTCYPPTTLSSASTVCSNAILPAFVQSNINPDKVVRCINPTFGSTRILFAIQNSAYPYVSSTAYVGSSLRLAGALKRDGFGNGELVRVAPGITRLMFKFTDKYGVLRPLYHQKVKVTGVLRRPGTLLPVCFEAFLQVC